MKWKQSLFYAAFVFGAFSTLAVAAPIHYGNYGPDFPPGITIYQDVEESSGTDLVPPALFGPPTLSGNVLDFDPTAFVASATGRAPDITDSQLNFDLKILRTNNLVASGLKSILISESGDFSLFGSGTSLTSVAGGVSIASFC